ncbi:MAG: hypothetical protein A2309_05555 [Bacteroidetes bacterium RIFOXYB2_FULL_35_7]|nr:MAG: hypothetical protein A2X01_00030 [Bacteroidetes bacterium GWF2_35_48]OFY94963.1 MAG: hypothetical protein A2309_05555 [Bacteroidetes bacterium RIFOXYB2_FULL_35_7]OFZ04214.1 MAG: hypothetical protein A2491_18130 [Bacteroidetes bacterium RIFOXYC12_FULL_35_7]HBX53052.1 hypothetical protein [Bacteroidales bacterium]
MAKILARISGLNDIQNKRNLGGIEGLNLVEYTTLFKGNEWIDDPFSSGIGIKLMYPSSNTENILWEQSVISPSSDRPYMDYQGPGLNFNNGYSTFSDMPNSNYDRYFFATLQLYKDNQLQFTVNYGYISIYGFPFSMPVYAYPPR